MTLPGGVSVILSRVGPGAFFALFGAILVALSFVYGVRIDTKAASMLDSRTGGIDTSAATYIGMFGARPHDSSDAAAIRAQVQSEIFFLNRTLRSALRADQDSRLRDEVDLNVRRIKLSLMALVWDEAHWGDYAQFRRWGERGAQEEPPPGSSKAVEYFNTGR